MLVWLSCPCPYLSDILNGASKTNIETASDRR
jgi:hypothetical protein